MAYRNYIKTHLSCQQKGTKSINVPTFFPVNEKPEVSPDMGCYIPVPVNVMLTVEASESFELSARVAPLFPVELGLKVMPRL